MIVKAPFSSVRVDGGLGLCFPADRPAPPLGADHDPLRAQQQHLRIGDGGAVMVEHAARNRGAFGPLRDWLGRCVVTIHRRLVNIGRALVGRVLIECRVRLLRRRRRLIAIRPTQPRQCHGGQQSHKKNPGERKPRRSAQRLIHNSFEAPAQRMQAIAEPQRESRHSPFGEL